MSGRAYITIVRWPKVFTMEQRVKALADSMGIDPYMAGLRGAQEPPFIAGPVSASAAPEIVARFKAHGALAFALTQIHIDRLPRPLPVKRLVPALGAAEPMYMVELWRGEPLGMKASDIFLLVRGTINRSTTRTQVSAPSTFQRTMGLPGLGMGLGLGIPGSVEVSHSIQAKFSQVLDIYSTDRTLLRLSSDRVSFDVLGKERGFTATENMDKVALRLAAEAPAAIIDTGFSRFKPPADVEIESSRSASTDSTTRQRDEGSAFDFYSGWIYTINRGLTSR